METIVITHEISGKPEIIVNPLNADSVRVGQFIHYRGFRSMGTWNCPGLIYWVDKKRKVFKVQSFDDMVFGDQEYHFDREKDQSSSRKNMRVITMYEAKKYLQQRQSELSYKIAEINLSIIEKQNELASLKKSLKAKRDELSLFKKRKKAVILK